MDLRLKKLYDELEQLGYTSRVKKAEVLGYSYMQLCRLEKQKVVADMTIEKLRKMLNAERYQKITSAVKQFA